MCSKYQQLFQIPDGFPALLKSLAREVLRAQPANVYEFGARYFAELLEQQKQTQDEPLDSMKDDEIEEFILGAFLKADVHGSGHLDRVEFAQVLKTNELRLKPWQIRKLMAEAADNNDGLINYQEFIPIFLEIIHTQKTVREAITKEGESGCLINGMGKEEFNQVLRQQLEKTAAGKPSMSLQSLKQVLSAPTLGLTRKDVNMLLGCLELGENSCVTCEEVMTKSYEMVFERHEDVLETGKVSNSAQSLFDDLMESFKIVDKDGQGTLPFKTVKKVLRDKSWDSLALTSFHIATILSSVSQNVDEELDYKVVAQITAEKASGFRDGEKRRLRQDAINKLSSTEGAKQMSFASPATVEVILKQTFKDADTNGEGFLRVEKVKEVLQKLSSSGDEDMQIPKQHLHAVFSAIDADENSLIDYDELSRFWTAVLDHVARENVIRELVNAGNSENK